jgi:predicted nucleic acid-binding protein
MKIVLDANCFIDAANPLSVAHPCLQQILAAARSGKIGLMVSRHTLAELARKPDAAYELAKTVEITHYWPIGTIAEQVAMIEQLAGTWEDARRNEQIQEELEQLAKSGNDIRDRGAYIDALGTAADAFVTSDRQLVGSGPAKRIEDRFRLRVLTPCNLVSEAGYETRPFVRAILGVK